jgi:hypothetical protein
MIAARLKALPTPPPSTTSTAEREKMRWENIFTRENIRARVEREKFLLMLFNLVLIESH